MKSRFTIHSLVLEQIYKELESRVDKVRIAELQASTLGLAKDLDKELDGYGNCETLITRIYNNPSKYPKCDLKKAANILVAQIDLMKKNF